MPIPELARDERFRQRFLREAQIAAALDEPHVVPTVAVGEDAGMLYLAMAYIDGLDLREILRREGPLDPERAVELIAQVAGALDAAHARGLVHRDVKPGNVLVASTDAGEHAYLCDFGLAKHISSVTSLTGDRNLVGTIAYISPEQIEGSAIDARADVYSLGCMLFECLTGQAPFTRESELAAVYAHMHEAPPLVSEARPEVSAAFDAVVVTAMAKAPGDRFASCGALAEASAAALRGRGTAASCPGGVAAAPSGRWRLRRSPPPPPWCGVVLLRGGGEADPARLEIPPKSLGLIDVRSHEVVGGIPFASQPWDVAFGGGEAWALLGDERRVARVDIASRKVLSTTTLPFTPGGIATGGGGAWVTEDGGDGLVRLDGTTGAIARAALHPGRGDRGNRSSSPTGIAFGAGSVWVARGSETVRVDPRSGAVEHRFPTPLAPTSVVFADGNVWVASAENGRIVRIDPVANRITAVTPLHGTVTDLAVDRDSVWVSIVPDDVVFRLSPDDGSVLATLPAGAGPSTLSAADGVWIADTRGREIVHVSADGTRDELPTTGTPWAARYHDGLLWASVAAAAQPAASGASSGALRIPLATDALGDLDPAVVGGPVFRQLAYSTCAHLLNYPDAEGGEGRELRPEVAAGMPTVSADGRTYRFRVRRGFRFSPPSGEEVTAETFRHTIERALSPRLAPGGGPNPYGQILADVEGATAYAAGRAPHIRGVAAQGDTLTIRLTRPAGDLAARLSTSTFCPVPRRHGGRSGRRRGHAHRHGGSLLRRLGGWRPDRRGEEPELHRQPAATGRADRLHGAASRPPTPSHGCSAAAPTTSTATSLGFDPAGPLVPGGSIDRSYGPASRAGRAGRPRYVASPAPGIDGIAFNTRRPLFRDARMRRAVGYALDRTALAAVYAEPPSDHLIPPAVSGLDGNVAYPNEPDLTTARRLAGGGRRTARLYGCGDPIGARIARIVRANLAPIGIDVQIDQSLGCLNGPEPRRVAAADMQLVSRVDPSHDPASRSSSSRSATGSRRPATGAPPPCSGRWRAPGAFAAPRGRPPTAGSRRPSCATPHPSRSTRPPWSRSSSRSASGAGSPRARSRPSISEPSAWGDGHPAPARLHVNLVSRSRGARPPGRAPRCTISVGVPVATSALRVAPSPSRRHRGERPTTTAPAVPAAATTPLGPGSARTGSTSTPTSRWMAMDADASSLLASPAPSRPVPRAPTSRSGTPAPAASQAPSSAAAQSWSPPPKSTETPPSKVGGADPVSSATSHGERSSRRAIASGTGPSRERSRAASTTVMSTSCVSARRAVSAPRERETKAAARVVTPSRPRSSRRARVADDGVGEQLLARDELGDQQLVAAERGETASDGDETVQRRVVPRGQEHGPDGVLRGGGGGRPGASRLGSCWRTRLSSSFSAGVGSRPNASTSAARPVRNRSRASACRPARYRAIINCAAQSLVERVVEHELLELGHELRAAAELELGPEASLRDREAQIAQALDHRTGERLEREVGQRRAPPLGERLPVEPDGRLGVARLPRRPGVVREALDEQEVERVRRHADPVAGRARLDDRPGRAGRALRLQEHPQLRDLAVHLRDRADRGRPAVQLLGEAVDRDDPVRIQQQDRQDRPLPGAAEADRPLRRAHLERAEDAEDEFQAATVPPGEGR